WFAYRITSAQKTKLKKLIVAVAKSDGRITDECQIHDIPARRWPCSAVSVGGSSGLILLSEKAEIRYEKASASSATGADRACTSTPPRLGPPTNERARLPLRSDCPSTYRSRGTSATNSALYATKKKTLSVPLRKPTTYSCWIVSTSSP